MEELLAIRPPIVFGHRARLPWEGLPMTSNETRRKPMKSTPRCDICNGKFGLIRHRFAQKQFCSKRCLNQYLVKRKQQPSSMTQWKAACGPEGVPVAERPIALQSERLEERRHAF